jgi:hypothetical protein
LSACITVDGFFSCGSPITRRLEEDEYVRS